jgi:hypothetical protein
VSPRTLYLLQVLLRGDRQLGSLLFVADMMQGQGDKYNEQPFSFYYLLGILRRMRMKND